MPNDTREMLAAVFALDDEAKREFEVWQAKQQQVLMRRSDPDRIVHKVYEPQQQRQQETVLMDEHTARRWDEWCDARIMRQLQPAFDGAAVGAGEMYRKLEKQIIELRLQVDALRTELNLSKAGNVTRLREAG